MYTSVLDKDTEEQSLSMTVKEKDMAVKKKGLGKGLDAMIGENKIA